MARTELKFDTMRLHTQDQQQLFLQCIAPQVGGNGIPVLLVHGEAEAGNIFYSRSGKGLACFLALAGYSVYVPDLRGRGKSWPLISRHCEFGFEEIICQDLPVICGYIEEKHPQKKMIWGGHGMGSVWLMSYLARFVEQAAPAACVFFSSRRQLSLQTRAQRLIVEQYFNKLGAKLTQWQGFWPARSMRMGSANESAQCFRDSQAWMSGEWLSSDRQFDYGAAIKQRRLPPILYFASASDGVFGQAADVRAFMQELGQHDGRLIILAKAQKDDDSFDHISMLTSAKAWQGHFLELGTWLQQCQLHTETI